MQLAALATLFAVAGPRSVLRRNHGTGPKKKFATAFAAFVTFFLLPALALAQGAPAAQEGARRAAGGEASLVLPNLNLVDVGGFHSRTLLMVGLVVSALGIGFALVILNQLKNLPVHRSMREISELIYETCKTYLRTQGRFIAILEVFIAIVIVLYFGLLSHLEPMRVAIILLFSVIGILGSYSVAWFGIRVNTYANSRTAFASLE